MSDFKIQWAIRLYRHALHDAQVAKVKWGEFHHLTIHKVAYASGIASVISIMTDGMKSVPLPTN